MFWIQPKNQQPSICFGNTQKIGWVQSRRKIADAPACGSRRVKPPAQKKKCIKFLAIPAKKKYKIDYISKTKNRTKKFIQAKNERQINYNIFCKFSHFWRKLNFWGAIRARLDASGAQTQYDVIWNFTPNIFFSILRIFNVEMVTSGGRVGGYALGWLDFPLFSRIVSELMAKVVYPCQ